MTHILDGKKISQDLLQWCKEKHEQFIQNFQKKASLGVLQIGEDPASCVYIGHKKKISENLGISFHHCLLPSESHPIDVIRHLQILLSKCHGVIIQLPLPKNHIPSDYLHLLPPEKDVDGLTSSSVHKPCTPLGCMALLLAYGYPIKGQNITVVGRSSLVGRPLGQLLIDADASVCMTHSKTQNLKPFFDLSHIVCVAAGVQGLITPDLVHSKLTLIDVGIHRGENGKLMGDVHPDVYPIVSGYSPVPGGVGPMTVACLMVNTLKAAFLQENKKDELDLFLWAIQWHQKNQETQRNQ